MHQLCLNPPQVVAYTGILPASKKCKLLPLGKWRTSLKQTDLPLNCQYLVLSDHLDMVGVELRATWTQTRKANGDKIQEKVSKTIGPWRTRKFMSLTMRPSSINSFVLSKVWFRCGSVDLRVADIGAVNSSIKSWLYSDMFEKPSEIVMCRPTKYGGLGVQSVKYRAQACLIRTFMETAVNPQFRNSVFHSHLFRYHVLGETSLPNPGFTPYYTEAFFQIIKKIHEVAPLDITTMSISQWTRILTENGLTMERGLNQLEKHYIPCRVENLFPQNDWELSWKRCRTKGLSSEMISFNFKVLHQLLPVKNRIHEISPSSSAACSLCTLSCPETIHHALIECPFNDDVARSLIKVVKNVFADVSTNDILLFAFPDVCEDQEFEMMFLVSAFLLEIWSRRTKKEKLNIYEIRTTIEAKCNLLRETRFKQSMEQVREMLKNL